MFAGVCYMLNAAVVGASLLLALAVLGELSMVSQMVYHVSKLIYKSKKHLEG